MFHRKGAKDAEKILVKEEDRLSREIIGAAILTKDFFTLRSAVNDYEVRE
jgi:hypothetical protein